MYERRARRENGREMKRERGERRREGGRRERRERER